MDAAGNPLPDTNASDTTHTVRAKLTYTYQAKYGGNLGYFHLTGTTNTLNQTSGYDPTTGLRPSDPTGALGATALSTRVNGNLLAIPRRAGSTTRHSGYRCSMSVSACNTRLIPNSTAPAPITMAWGGMPRTITRCFFMFGPPMLAGLDPRCAAMPGPHPNT